MKSNICVLVLLLSTLLLNGIRALAGECGPVPISFSDEKFGPKNNENYNREVVGWRYGEFAAASSDAYIDLRKGSTDPLQRAFHLADDDNVTATKRNLGATGWRRFIVSRKFPFQENHYSGLGGLEFDTYYRINGNNFIVLVAYRGTRVDSLWGIVEDTTANLSWITQWFNPFDQYRQARRAFADIKFAASELAGMRRVSYITTGHSLGGGIALHVASYFDCVSAVVFNASFVTNELRSAYYRPATIFVYEDDDLFSRFAAITSQQDNTSRVAAYRLNAQLRVPGWLDFLRQHSSEQIAAGSLRYALTCVKDGPCAFKEAQIARTLYCKRYQGLRGRSDPDACE